MLQDNNTVELQKQKLWIQLLKHKWITHKLHLHQDYMKIILLRIRQIYKVMPLLVQNIYISQHHLHINQKRLIVFQNMQRVRVIQFIGDGNLIEVTMKVEIYINHLLFQKMVGHRRGGLMIMIIKHQMNILEIGNQMISINLMVQGFMMFL